MEFDYSALTPDERARMRSLAQLPDAEVWALASADATRDHVAWLEWEARWAARLAAWEHAQAHNHQGIGPKPALRYPVWVKVALEGRVHHAPEPATRRGRFSNLPRRTRLFHAVPKDTDADVARTQRGLNRLAYELEAAERAAHTKE